MLQKYFQCQQLTTGMKHLIKPQYWNFNKPNLKRLFLTHTLSSLLIYSTYYQISTTYLHLYFKNLCKDTKKQRR